MLINIIRTIISVLFRYYLCSSVVKFLMNTLFDYTPGQTIPLGVRRGSQDLQIQVTLGERNGQ
jgi:hypothetical protein